MRSVANSRVRCATVIERVLKMTKAPTKRATPPNASRKARTKVMNPVVSFSSAARLLGAGATCASAGTIRFSASTSCAEETPSRAATAIES